MSARDNEKFYWFKMKKDFFKSPEMVVVKTMPNGPEYIIFYLQLMCEALDKDGRLRFSEFIPYDVNMLAAITNTNVDIVRGAMALFQQMDLIRIFDDGTVFMTQVQQLTGSETGQTIRKREAQLKKEATPLLAEPAPKPSANKPTREEVAAYCKERGKGVDPDSFYEYYEASNWKGVNWKQKMLTWESNASKRVEFVGIPESDHMKIDIDKSMIDDELAKILNK